MDQHAILLNYKTKKTKKSKVNFREAKEVWSNVDQELIQSQHEKLDAKIDTCKK